MAFYFELNPKLLALQTSNSLFVSSSFRIDNLNSFENRLLIPILTPLIAFYLLNLLKISYSKGLTQNKMP